jgi:hypothetical protein
VWSEVLHISPNEPRAREYLRAARRGAQSDEHIVAGGSSELRGTLERLLAERKYEEALDFLHTARWKQPDAPEISRGIHLLKERLLRRYLARIGTLDAVPRVSPTADIGGLIDEERAVLRLVDGISTFGDIARESRFGRFETYRTLSRFVTAGIVAAAQAVDPATAGAAGASAPAAPSPQGRRRSVWIATEIAVAALVVGGGALYLLGRNPAPAAAVSAAEPARVEPPAPPPAPASAVAEAPRPAVALLPEAHSEVILEISPDTPVTTPVVDPKPELLPAREPRPRPAPRRAPPARAAATPQPPAAAPEPGAEPAAAAMPPPAPVVDPPAAPPAEKPAPPPPAPTSFEATVEISNLAVTGPLARGGVDRAVARIGPALQACYARAAAAARRNAAGAVRVVLTIDETGRAQDVSATGAPIAGVDACILDAARQLRTRNPPDVGTARVTFTVTITPRGR